MATLNKDFLIKNGLVINAGSSDSITFPTSRGGAGQVLVLDGSGNLSFTTPFDGAYSSLTGTPSIPTVLTDLSITDGTSGQVLTTNGSGSFTFQDPSGGIENVVEDTTPQLGGNLDLNGNSLVDASREYLTFGDSGNRIYPNVNGYTNDGQGYFSANTVFFDFDKSLLIDAAGDELRIAAGGQLQLNRTSPSRLDGFTGLDLILRSGGAYPQGPGAGNLQLLGGNGNGAYDAGDVIISGGNSSGDPASLDGKVIIEGLTYPASDGSNGQVLTTDGSGNLSFADVSGFISNVVEDTTPQLGGDLDLNGNSLVDDSRDYLTFGDSGNRIYPSANGYTNDGQGYFQQDTVFFDFDKSFRFQTDGNSFDIWAGAQLRLYRGSSSRLESDAAQDLILRSGYGSGSSSAGDIVITAGSGSFDPASLDGKVIIEGLTYPASDGSNGQVLTTDGAGNLSFTTVSSGGIALTDLSVTQNTASGNGTLSYNNTNGVFTYTPPDLSPYLTSVAFSDLTSTPTTIAGYGITDAFDGAFSSLSGTPTTIAGYGITDAFDGAYSSLTGAPTNVSSFTNDSGYITGYTVTEGDVTAHEAALSITKSQVTDLATSDLDLGANKILYSNVYSNLVDLPTASSYHGMFAHVHGTGKAYYAHAGSWVELANVSELFDGAYSSLTGAPTNVSSFTNDAGYLTSETTTTLTADSVNQKLVFTDETGTPNDVDLSWAVDDTNLARLTSGTVDANTGIATFTRDDATDFTVDFSALFDDTNLTRITSGSVSGNDLTLTRSDATTVVIDVTSLNAAGGISNVVEDTTPQLGGNLLSNGNNIHLEGTGATPAEIKLYEAPDSGSNYVALRASPLSMTADYTITLPFEVGANSQVLATSDTGYTYWRDTFDSLVEDTTPQLGGDLETQGSKIFAGSNVEDLILEGGLNSTTDGLQFGGSVYISGGAAPNSVGGGTGSVNITGRTTVTGNVVLKGEVSSVPPQLQFYEAADNGTGRLILKGPDSIADNDNVTLTLPAADGTNGQALTTDGAGNLSFADVSAETDRYAYEDTKTFVVTVDTKDSTHPQFNNGSANGYKIDGAFAPFIHMVPGMTYRFDQSDASNSGHPVVFYYDENKTTSYTDGVTNNGTPGSAGAYTQIIVSDTTPSTLYYQCSVHALMGWGASISTHNLTGLDTDDLTEGAGNLYYTTSRFNTDFGNKSTSDLSEGTNLYHTTERARTSINATGDISYNSATGTISFNNSSGYLTSETYSTASELLTAIKTVDGASSGLEADLLDGQEGSYYLNYSNLSNTPTSILDFGITDGTAGQVLQTDGSGNFSFTTVSGGGEGGVGYAGYEDYFFNVSSQTSTFGTSADAHDKVQVFVNGAYLDDSDFTFNATTGIVTLTTAAENGDEVSIWAFNSTGLSNHELFTVDGSGNITAPGTVQIGNHRKEGSLTSTIASTSPTNVVMYASADYVGSKLIVTVTDTVTGDTQITEALILTVNGGTPKITTYGTMYTSANALASFDVANVSTNTALEVTMASSNSSTVKVAYTLIDV